MRPICSSSPIGLTLIFGVMKILNVTHGSFYAFGAYGAATAVGVYFEPRLAGGRRLPAHGAGSPWLIGLVIGLILERGLLRLVYGRTRSSSCWSPTRCS